jgi:hypothetical protein
MLATASLEPADGLLEQIKKHYGQNNSWKF